MFITRKHLSRRTVLRGLGVSVALPLLEADADVASAGLDGSTAGLLRRLRR